MLGECARRVVSPLFITHIYLALSGLVGEPSPEMVGTLCVRDVGQSRCEERGNGGLHHLHRLRRRRHGVMTL